MDTLRRLFSRYRRPMLFSPNNEGGAGGGAGAGVQDPPAGGDGGGAGAGGGEPQNWLSALPEDIRTSIPEEFSKDQTITKYKDLPEFLKGVKNMAAVVGKKGIILPGENATPEEVEKFYEALGRPKTPAEYKFSELKDLHPSIKPTPESIKKFQDAAHKLGLPTKTADGLNQWYLGELSAMMKQQEAAKVQKAEAAETALRQEWGANYDAEIAAASKFVEAVGGADALKAFEGDGTGRNPVMLRLFAKAGKLISEDAIKSLGGNQPQETPKDEIDKIMSDPKHPYNDEKHPEHSQWIGMDGKMRKLYLKAGN